MTNGSSKALDLAKKVAGEKASKAATTKKALEQAKAKLGIFKEAGKQLKELARDFKTMGPKERLIKAGGLVALVTLGWILKKEDVEHLKKGQDEVGENETHKNTDAEKAHAKAKKQAEKEVEDGKKTEEEMSEEFDPKADEVISKKQTATNMYAIRYYKNKKGKKHSSPNSLARICMKEKAIPSTFILERSSALFKDGVGSFEDFKKNVTDKLVRKSVKDPKERIRQAAVILSCCAVGRFQIIPTFFFKSMGWKTRGEEGLRDMYNYIRSTDRQIATFKKIISGQWSRYKDPGLVAVAYYAGDKTAAAYKKNPDSDRFRKKQYGGHRSIHSYAENARRNFNKFKSECPGLKDLDYVAMTIEANETGKGIIYARAKQGKGISGTRVA